MKRSHVFRLIAISLPLILFVIVEIGLEVCHYGYRNQLFEEDEDSRFLVMNLDVSKKYFTESQNATIGNRDIFFKKKPENTLRFFVLGESSSLGFPYMHNGSFARMLKYKLQFQFPKYRIEIVNLSLTAINSYTLNDFSKQLVDYNPDGILIYAGHNEYYGALGVASSNWLGRDPWFVETMLKFRSLKLSQVFSSLWSSLTKQHVATENQNLTLMERMAVHNHVPYQSTLYKAGVKQFNHNLSKILQLFDELHVPVFVGTLACNLKGQSPMDKDTVTSIYNANQEYHFGEKAYNDGAYDEARKHYLMAKEYDALRFRAPKAFNAIIRNCCGLHRNAHLVDVESKLAASSNQGIIGNELMLEHVHPNLTGQRLIADAFFDVLVSNFPAFKNNENKNLAIDLAKDYPLTAFDSICGDLAIWKLKQQWPFNEAPAKLPENKSFEYETAVLFLNGRINWGEAMQRLNNQYIIEKKYSKALRIVEQMCLELPYEPVFLRQAASLCIRLNEKEKSSFYLKELAYVR